MSDESDLVPKFPVEFLVKGTPVSLQCDNAAARNEWKDRVKKASYAALIEGHWASAERMAVTIFYFAESQKSGDIDNTIKLILDALKQHIYMDDKQVERVVAQKFEPPAVVPFKNPSAKLNEALLHPKPVVYIRISDDPFEDLP
jgi:hypothetical protein